MMTTEEVRRLAYLVRVGVEEVAKTDDYHPGDDALAQRVSQGADNWEALKKALQARMEMARPVLDEAGHGGVPVVIPIEEVQFWMRDLEDHGAIQ